MLNSVSGVNKPVFCAIMGCIITVFLPMLVGYYFILSLCIASCSVLQRTVFCKLTFLCFLDNWLWQKVSQCETSKNLELQGKKFKGDCFPFCFSLFCSGTCQVTAISSSVFDPVPLTQVKKIFIS